jgi:hypothetical protein
MIRQITLTALSGAFILAGASVAAIAAGKKGEARHAYAAQPAAAAQQQPQDEDPRTAYMHKRKGGDQSWCDADAQCNGWGQWLQDVESGKRKAGEQ